MGIGVVRRGQSGSHGIDSGAVGVQVVTALGPLGPGTPLLCSVHAGTARAWHKWAARGKNHRRPALLLRGTQRPGIESNATRYLEVVRLAARPSWGQNDPEVLVGLVGEMTTSTRWNSFKSE